MALGPFLWGRGGAALTPEQVAREREIAQALIGQGVDTSPVGHWLQGAARMANSLAGNIREGRASRAETEGRSSASDAFKALGGSLSFPDAPVMGGSAGTSSAMAAVPAPDYSSARVAQSHGGAGQPSSWLSYSNQGATRNLPISGDLERAMSFLPEMGITMDVYSGGQPAKGSGGKRVGSTRHDHGNAADVMFRDASGRMLDWNTPSDIPVLQSIVQRARAAGVTGFGAGDDYMGAGRMHIGFGNPGVWGAGGRGVNAPDWLAQAYNSPANAQTSAPAVSAVNALADGGPMPQSPVIVAETPEEIVAAEAAMGDPAFAPIAQSLAAPSMGDPRMVQDMPIAGQSQPDMSRIPVMAGGIAGAMAPGAMPPVSMQQIMDVIGNQWSNPGERSVAQALLGQQMQQADPMRQLQMQKAQLELQQMQNPQASLINAGGGQLYNPNTGEWISAPGGGGAGEGPAAFQTLAMRAQAAGLQPGTPEYQQFMAQGGRSPEESAANQRIERLTENLMSTGDFIDPMDARNIAVGIADGRLRADRHPITGVLQVVDMATGQPAYEQRTPQPTAGDAMLSPQPSVGAGQFGQQYPNSQGAFGVEGAAQGAINRVTDTLGMGPAYPDVAQTQADFGVLRESLLNDISSSYGRQPPSWLLKEIRDLTPEAGSVFQGSGAAQSKLRALGRHLASELENTNTALRRELSPTNRQEMEARQQGLISGVARVNGALQSFEGKGGQAAGAPQPGMVEDGYRFKGGDPSMPDSWEPVR